MIVAVVFLAAIGLLAFMTTSAEAGRALDTLERVYLMITPTPVLLVFLVPSVAALLLQQTTSVRAWGDRLSAAGVWVSLVLVVAGTLLGWRRRMKDEAVDRRIVAGLLLASIPGFLVGLVGLLYAL